MYACNASSTRPLACLSASPLCLAISVSTSLGSLSSTAMPELRNAPTFTRPPPNTCVCLSSRSVATSVTLLSSVTPSLCKVSSLLLAGYCSPSASSHWQFQGPLPAAWRVRVDHNTPSAPRRRRTVQARPQPLGTRLLMSPGEPSTGTRTIIGQAGLHAMGRRAACNFVCRVPV